MNKKQFVYDYIHQRTIGVLATTAKDGHPEAAVMEFGDTPDLELIFDTRTATRKYKNIKNNPRVAFVIGWEKGTTVQYEGIARELHGEELRKYKAIMFAKNPDFQRWEHIPDMTYFVIKPLWVRYSPWLKQPWEIRF